MSNELIEVLIDYGWVTFLFIGILYISWTLLFDRVRRAFRYDNYTRPSANTDLRYNSFFSSTQYKLMVEIPSLEISPTKPIKQEMFRDLIRIKISSIYDMCKDIVEFDMDDWSSEQWASEVTNKIGNMIDGYNKQAIKEGMPNIVMLKFSRWQTNSLELLYDYVNMLGSSTIYNTNTVRTNTLLLIMSLLILTIIGDAERTLSELNGEITGQLYHGNAIEH